MASLNYKPKVFQLLDAMPGRQAYLDEILRRFDELYGDELTPHFRADNASGQIRWQHSLKGMLTAAKREGLLDQPERSVWRLTEAGRRWLAANAPMRQAGMFSQRAERIAAPPARPARAAGASAGRRRRSARSAEAQPADLARAASILAVEIGSIRSFINGRSEHRPSDEKLCDWVQFCYMFEFFHEGRTLFTLVDPAGVEPWHYQRTKRFAKICANRLAGA